MANDMGQAPMGGGQPAPGGAPPEGAAPGGDQDAGGPPSIDQMVVSIDQGLTQVAQLIGQANPDAGEQLAALNEQYRQIITTVVEGAGGGGGGQPADQGQVDANGGAGGVPAQF